MSKTVLYDVQAYDASRLKSGTWIVVFHADKVPPHLGLIANGSYYSLTYESAEIEMSLAPITRVVESKQIPSLFIELNSLPQSELLNGFFKAYERAIPGVQTCLNPIKDYIHAFHQLDVSQVQMIFHLVDKLTAYDLILGSMQNNLHDLMKDGDFEMLEYALTDIYERIKELGDQNELA